LGMLLFVLGIFGGMFIVPLNAAIQRTAGKGEKGIIISTSNLIDRAGVVVASIIGIVLEHFSGVSPRAILVVTGMSVLAYVCTLVAICAQPPWQWMQPFSFSKAAAS